MVRQYSYLVEVNVGRFIILRFNFRRAISLTLFLTYRFVHGWFGGSSSVVFSILSATSCPDPPGRSSTMSGPTIPAPHWHAPAVQSPSIGWLAATPRSRTLIVRTGAPPRSRLTARFCGWWHDERFLDHLPFNFARRDLDRCPANANRFRNVHSCGMNVRNMKLHRFNRDSDGTWRNLVANVCSQ